MAKEKKVDLYKDNPYTLEEIKDLTPLKTLVDRKDVLLFYSKRYQLKNNTGRSKIDSIKDIEMEYNQLNNLSKNYFDTLVNIIAETQNTGTSFEGLIFENRPLIKKSGDGFDRIEFYDQDTQQISICTAPKIMHFFKEHSIDKEIEISSEKDCISNILHEVTHAIDDNVNNYISGQKVQDLYSDKHDIEMLKQQMNLAAKLVSPSGTPKDHYLESYYNKEHFENQYSKAPVNITLLEYLSFHNEIIFDLLKKCNSPAHFKELYSQHIKEFATGCPGSEANKIAALDLIKALSKDFLEVVINYPKINMALKMALQSIIPTIEKTKAIVKTIKVEDIRPIPSLGYKKRSRRPKKIQPRKKVKTGHETLPNTTLVTKLENTLWDAEKIIKSIKQLAPNVSVQDPGMNEVTLANTLGNVVKSDNNKYVILINQNAITAEIPKSSSGANSNHWSGVYIEKTGKNISKIVYLDPLGNKPSDQVQNIIATTLKIEPKIIKQPTSGKAMQYSEVMTHKSKETIQELSNTKNDCGPYIVYLLSAVANDITLPDKAFDRNKSESIGQELRQEITKGTKITDIAQKIDNYDNKHLKYTGKAILSRDRRSYNLQESLATINSNSELVERLNREAVVTSDIDLKSIAVKKTVANGREGTVEFLAESNHQEDHARNVQSLINGIESKQIGKDTVIAMERKQYGQNLGVKDAILLAGVLEHNDKHPGNKLQIPDEITKNSLIYHDAKLYNLAKKHGVKIIGLEGKNLNADKSSPDEYNRAREDYMVSRINELKSKGYNVIAHVGLAHVDNLQKALEPKNQGKKDIATHSKIPSNLQQQAAAIGVNARNKLAKTDSKKSIPGVNKFFCVSSKIYAPINLV